MYTKINDDIHEAVHDTLINMIITKLFYYP